MRRTLIADRSRREFGQMLLAVVLGATAGLFISGYWLIDLLPSDSKLLIALSAVASVAAALAYWRGIERIVPQLRELSIREILPLILGAALLACFLFFAGTSQWQESGRYISFLLPRQQFLLTSTSAQSETSIAWITTSLGDVSYDTLSTTGWDRRGDQMVLRDPLNNSMEWRGRTGDRIEIVFASPDGGGDLRIAWGDRDERIHLNSGKASYQRSFPVPYFASPQFVLALGLLQFWLLSVAGLLVGRRLLEGMGESVRQVIPSEESGSSGKRELLVLAAMMALALLLRAFNLGVAFPAVDEYYHLIAADQLLDGVPMGSVYSRGLWIVTIPVASALRLLGHEVWVARSVGVVFNVLAMLPLYALTRKVSRSSAIAVGLLYASSPWIITFARVAREYAYYPLYFYSIVLAMVTLVDAIPRNLKVKQEWRGLVRPRVALLVLVLLLPPIFALRIDWLSTFRTILIAYLVLGLFLLARFDWRASGNWPFLAAAAILLAWAGWFFYREQLTKLLLVPRINPVPLEYFFPNPPQQWYFDRAGVIVAVAVAIAVVVALWRRQATTVPLFVVGLFTAYLSVFALFSRSFFHTRHLISTQFWFVALAGMGLCWLWEWVTKSITWKGKATPLVVAMVVSLLILNPNQILLPTVSRDADMPISEDYLHDMSTVQAYMVNHVRDGDALISTVYGLYATWEGAPRFGQQFRINSGSTLEEITSIVQGQESGWIVIDAIRLDMAPFSERSLTNMPQMEYIGSFGDEHVWRWGRPLAGSSASAF